MTKRPSLWLAAPSVAGAIVLTWFVVLATNQGGFGYDAFAYWDLRLDAPYARSFGQITALGAFRYSPPIAVLFAPLHLLPWPLYLALWTALLTCVLAWLGGKWTLACCLFVGVPMSLYEGNIDFLVAASIVLGFRRPWALAFAILTKVTPALLLLYFVAKRDWRSVWVILAVVIALVLASSPFVESSWGDYFRMLLDNSRTDDASLVVVRGAGAALLCFWAGRTDRPWVAALAVAIAQPTFGLRSASVGMAAVAIRRSTRPDPRPREVP